VTETSTNSVSNEKHQNEANEEAAFFCPVQLDEGRDNAQEMANEQKLQELLHSINEESSQLSGFLAEENKLIIELCTSLSQILKKLNLSFNIPAQNLSLNEKVKKVVLNEEGHLKLLHEKGREQSAFLAEYPPEVVMTVLWNVVPELSKGIASYKKTINKRINFFEEIKKELKTIAKAIIGNAGQNPSSSERKKDTTMQEASEAEKQSQDLGC
jgi:hypothetical protein